MKLKNVIIAALVAAFLCLEFAHAETEIIFGGVSTHTMSDAPNEFHRTAMVKHGDWFGGYFRNSFNDDSFALGYAITDHLEGFDVALNVGAVYGYRKNGNCYKTQKEGDRSPKIICPMIAPEVIFRSLPLSPSISLYGLDALVLNFRLPASL